MNRMESHLGPEGLSGPRSIASAAACLAWGLSWLCQSFASQCGMEILNHDPGISMSPWDAVLVPYILVPTREMLKWGRGRQAQR